MRFVHQTGEEPLLPRLLHMHPLGGRSGGFEAFDAETDTLSFWKDGRFHSP